MPPTPAILLAFANDWVDDRRHLRSLLDEGKAIADAITPLVESGALVLPPPIHNATVDDVISAFREPRHRDRIRIFHFGGHASGSMLLFEDDAGQPTEAHASGFAGYLGRQRGLVLVFLNGCCTEPQVRRLRDAGVKAVVATTSAIQDAVAAEFATTFYAELAARPLREAFETAEQAIRLRWGDDPRSVMRDVGVHDARETPWPWIIDCDPDHEGWMPSAETQGAARVRRRRRVLAIAASVLVLAMSLALSAAARRAMCRAPGVRSLCAAAGISPTRDEQAQWDEALAQDAEDGLLAYLRAYPDGVHADEARTRLAACWSERVETLGPRKELPYAWPVSQDVVHPRPTEQEARDDALARGNADATRHCAPLRATAQLESAVVEPKAWDCAKLAHGFVCGFSGDLVCVVRDRITSEVKHCRDKKR